jgi:hypothetical protein
MFTGRKFINRKKGYATQKAKSPNNMNSEQIQKRYFLHTILNKFTQNLFFSFGALLIYYKTGSIPLVIVYYLTGNIAAALTKSIGLKTVVRIMRKFGFIPAMTGGLLINMAGLLVIFSLNHSTSYFLLTLLLVTAISHIGIAVYHVGNTTLQLEIIGNSKTPGFSAAKIDIINIAGGLLAVAAGVIFHHYERFDFLFLIGALMMFASTIPLYGIPAPAMPDANFFANIKAIPKRMLLANFNPDHEIQVVGLPLIILLASASLKFSIQATAAIGAFSIILSYINGKLIDRKRSTIVWVALIIGIIFWSSYIFIEVPLWFAIAGIAIALTMNILTLYREAHMGLFMRQTGDFLNATFVVEFARSFGSFFGNAILLLAYLAFGSLHKNILAFSWLFLLPLALYAASSIKLNSESMDKVKIS